MCRLQVLRDSNMWASVPHHHSGQNCSTCESTLGTLSIYGPGVPNLHVLLLRRWARPGHFQSMTPDHSQICPTLIHHPQKSLVQIHYLDAADHRGITPLNQGDGYSHVQETCPQKNQQDARNKLNSHRLLLLHLFISTLWVQLSQRAHPKGDNHCCSQDHIQCSHHESSSICYRTFKTSFVYLLVTDEIF